MAKSISLSTDMKTIYLIDPNGFSQAFSLSGNGVIISTSNGDVTVSSASAPLQIGNDDFEVGVSAQWDISYHENSEQAMMIGNDDIEPGVTAEVFKYNLDKGKEVNLRLNTAQTKLLART